MVQVLCTVKETKSASNSGGKWWRSSLRRALKCLKGSPCILPCTHTHKTISFRKLLLPTYQIEKNKAMFRVHPNSVPVPSDETDKNVPNFFALILGPIFQKCFSVPYLLRCYILYYLPKVNYTVLLSRVTDPNHDPHQFGKPDPDPHWSEKLDPDPHSIKIQEL